ncbi:MAG TPA: cbb3-type cytochrome c oxidase subunit I [Candidatus Sulfotelmatobacter sp.]|jgi:cytochrome c oxidase cbb3-type subunit 1|nr:cbb3-type cytochrome c oxidase subunit I [Candidatus Sulfotelmatobacter sp.]
MNPADTNQDCSAKIDASCRVPLLVLFNGAALWLVLGLALSLFASLTFHAPEQFSCCPYMTYGHAVAAASDLLVYGFVIPAALGVMLWIFARLSQDKLELPLVVFLAGHLWHLGVFVGTVGILTGHSTGYQWLEYPRAADALLGVAFVLIAISAFATFGLRKERELYPSHWFLLAALLVFPWIYSSANVFIVTNHPVRGVGQAVINWWFANNLIFVWLALAGLGIAFYFLPKIANRPLHSRFWALFAFWTLLLFGTWLGIPAGAPVPAWLPAASQFASLLMIVPIVATAVILKNILWGANVKCFGGTYCYIRFGSVMFVVSALMLVAAGCPDFSRTVEFTWFGTAQAQLQILGFATMILAGAIYEIIPRTMGTALPFEKFKTLQFFASVLGVLLLVISLAVAGIAQGKSNFASGAGKIALMVSTTGWLFLLLGSLSLLLNILVMTMKWKLGLAKSAWAAITAPLADSEVKS